jgi:hypothetical protein
MKTRSAFSSCNTSTDGRTDKARSRKDANASKKQREKDKETLKKNEESNSFSNIPLQW